MFVYIWDQLVYDLVDVLLSKGQYLFHIPVKKQIIVDHFDLQCPFMLVSTLMIESSE